MPASIAAVIGSNAVFEEGVSMPKRAVVRCRSCPVAGIWQPIPVAREPLLITAGACNLSLLPPSGIPPFDASRDAP